MKWFLQNIGILFIITGVVLLTIYNIFNRIGNLHFAIAGFLEIFGLTIYIITNKFIEDS